MNKSKGDRCRNYSDDDLNLHTFELDEEIRLSEIQCIKQALQAAKGNIAGAARHLGVSQEFLMGKLKQHDLPF